ncbi:MAG: hypothetical protein B7C24_14355 [Bacteroidetes bacterium 4572_77]|nr:MAG: hypothetical protein B7C24_14355 [Bacteroidetes bacterium 4572_77]
MRVAIMILLLSTISIFSATQSVIIEADGIASMGDTKSRKETISEAKKNAKRNAAENAGTYIKSETVVKNYMTEKDLMEAYSQAIVKVIEVISGEWVKDDLMGDSYKIKVKVEVIPKLDKIKEMVNSSTIIDDPTAPLTVKTWSDKKSKSYKKGEKIKVYLKGNKPFYARVVYKQLDGTLIQILPNPYRKDNYFNGGTMYELPSGKDQYELEVAAPYGKENVIVYASTQELGDVSLSDAESLYIVNESQKNTGIKTRGIKIKKKSKNSKVAEFFETEIEINTEE